MILPLMIISWRYSSLLMSLSVLFVFSLKANRWKERTEICKYEAALHQTRAAAALVNGSLHWMMWIATTFVALLKSSVSI